MDFFKRIYARLSTPTLSWSIKIGVTLLVLYLVNKSVARNQLSLIRDHCHALPLLASALVGCIGYFLQVKRWQIILRWCSIHIGLTSALRNVLWGSLLAFITPGRTGEFFRGLSLSAANKENTVWCAAVDKLFAGAAALFFGLLGCVAAMMRGRSFIGGHWINIIAAAAITLTIGIGCFARGREIHTVLHNRFTGFRFRTFVIAELLSIGAQALLLVQTAVLFVMFGSVGFVDAMAYAGLSYSCMLFFPFFIANMGIREYCFGMFLSHGATLGPLTASAAAFGASVGILAMNMVGPAFAGLVWWLMSKKKPAR